MILHPQPAKQCARHTMMNKLIRCFTCSYRAYILDKGISKFFSIKGKILNTLGFVDPIVSIATIQFCHCIKSQPQTIDKLTSKAVFQ